jgi:hypothetical protein
LPGTHDLSLALASFQQALLRGEIEPEEGDFDKTLFVLRDAPPTGHRLTYTRIDGKKTVTAFVMVTPVQPIGAVPSFQVGYAVPEAYRGQGRAQDLLRAAIEEFTKGMASVGVTDLYVEATVGMDSEASKRVANAVLSPSPMEIIDKPSGLPALRYVRKFETKTAPPPAAATPTRKARATKAGSTKARATKSKK